jgi:hypothetical protein
VAVFVAVGITSIENEVVEHNVTERSSPAVESASEKSDVAENSKKIDSGKDIGVEVTIDAGSWTEIIAEETRTFLTEVYPVRIYNIIFPKDEFGRSFSSSYYHKVMNNWEKIHRNWLIYSKLKNSVLFLL